MRKDASSLAGSERIHELKIERRSRNRGCIAAFAPAPAVSARSQHNQYPMIPATQIWNFSTLLSAFFKLWLLPLAQVSAFGEPLTCWKATETTTPALMLMYSKEANNRKQEIDRQHHTIPNQRANDKHHGNVYNLLFRYGKVRSQNMEKLKSSFPTFCKRTFPQLHKIASYAHYAQCRLLRKPSHFIIYSRK